MILPRVRDHDAAVVGIGTMIVFIATVLVAVIASGVLIETSGELQSQSKATGQQATDDVAGNLRIQSVVGLRNNTGQAEVIHIEVYVTPAAGAPLIDLTETRLQAQTATHVRLMEYSTTSTPGGGLYKAEAVRDADQSFSTSDPIITEGDLVKLNFTATSNGFSLAPRTEAALRIDLEVGSGTVIEFRTPATFGAKTVIPLA